MSRPLRSDTLDLVKAQVEKQAWPLTMLALMWLVATRDDKDNK